MGSSTKLTNRVNFEEGFLNRAKGCLLGLAVGDALGATLEFSIRDSLPLHTEMTGGGPFGLKPGEWTDDTAMAIALGESLRECRGFNPRDVMDRFLDWQDNGTYSCTGTCFDVGITTSRALAAYRRDGNPFAGVDDQDAAGNGSLMRLAPAVLFQLATQNAASTITQQQCLLTHGAPQAVQACALFATITCEAINGASKTSILAPRFWSGHPDIKKITGGDWKGKDRKAIKSSGYVAHTLEAAMWCVERTDNFEAALTLAVNLADDADTVGAVTGQLAGAIYGLDAIPSKWLRTLSWRSRIEALAVALLAIRTEKSTEAVKS